MSFTSNLNEKDGIIVKPDGPFYSDILLDYLGTTTYRWEHNHPRTLFFIEAFEFTPLELYEMLKNELETQNIQVEFKLNEN